MIKVRYRSFDKSKQFNGCADAFHRTVFQNTTYRVTVLFVVRNNTQIMRARGFIEPIFVYLFIYFFYDFVTELLILLVVVQHIPKLCPTDQNDNTCYL